MAASESQNTEKSRYVKQAIVVMEIFPEIMQDLVMGIVQPQTLYNLLQNSVVLDKLTSNEKDVFSTLPTDGYYKCGTILLYKLVRQQLVKPRQGWGKPPLDSDMSISDDIERIRILQDSFVNIEQTNITDDKDMSFFCGVIELAKRFDQYFERTGQTSFEKKVTDLQHLKTDTELEEKYLSLAEEFKRSNDESLIATSFNQAQIPVIIHLPSSVRLRKRITNKDGGISCACNDCTIISNQIVLTDSGNDRLVVIQIDGNNQRFINLNHKPLGIDKINKTTVAVTYRTKACIHLININTGDINNTIDVSDGQCGGISYNARSTLLYVVVGWTSIHVMDLSGKVMRVLSSPVVMQSIETDVDRLYYSDDYHVYCCDLQGQVIWQFTDSNIRGVRGISTDGIGNVYIASYTSQNVIVVSPDGLHSKELLTRADGIHYPIAIHCNRSDDSLVVCNKDNGIVHLFNIERRRLRN